jgi:hypothetical protein
LLIGTVTDLALVMEEHRAAHRIAGLALVQPGMAMLAQVGVLTRRWREMDSNFRFRCVRRS